MKTKRHKTSGATAKLAPDTDLGLQIERRAYEIWTAGGGQNGEDVAHWLQAETEVLEQQRQARLGQPSAGV